ncbi:tripartite motif-containing protein 3 [Biomphalaria pfeifferi]|uniref:Tripartite motif-containing protein 3 n=1 Tax=Biomphalaria pfeifferi TaxID=112525 RepID=A0AAD8FAA0_BIOPF|nr:tripartite motif-containing protein 3 [Biomphalaria pfeifferi]
METEDRIKDVIEKHCSCIICHGVLRLPKLLPCFHSFCTDCLEKYISEKISENGQRSFPCPKCSKPIIVPSDVDNQTCLDSFKTDTFTCKLIEVIQAFSSEKSCDICSRRDVTEAATNWCMQCRDAICGDCLKVHICGKTTSDHRVISLEDLHNLSLENVLKDNVLEKCVKHEEYVKMYCMNCKEPVCVECFATVHRKCDNCVLVSDAVKTLDADVAEVFLRLRSLKEEGNDFVPSLQTHEDIFEASLRKAETDIRSLAEELRRKIDMSEKDLLEELHSAGRHLREKLSESKYSNGTVDLCDMTILTSAQERLDTLLKYGSSSEILDVYNKLKELLMKAEGKNSSTHEDQLKWKVNFEIDKKVKAFNQDFDQLGEIKVDDGSVDEGLSLWGVTVTSRDDIVVLDSRSHVLQKFSSAGERIDQLALSEEPRDITSFGEDEVAVSVVGKQILILSTLTKFIMKRKIDTPKQYDGLEYSSSLRLFLASSLENSCLDVVSRLGEVIRTVSVNNSTGDPLFQTPRYVTFTKEGTYIVSDITGNCVVCLSQDGTQLYSYPSDHDHDLRKPQGVCSDKLGNVFVAEYANSRVHLLTSNGQFQRFVIDKETGLQRPVAIAMTQSSKLVVVQSDGMVKVFSYESEPHSPKSPVTSSHGANEEKDQTILHHYGSLGIRRLSSYGGQGSGTSYAKMFNHPGAIHTAGAGFHSYRRHSESFSPKSPSAQQSPFPNLPNSLKPRHTNN